VGDKISILVASRYDEDHAKILAELSDQSDFYIAGSEKDEFGTIVKSEKLKPNVLIIDLYLPETGGLELAPMVHRRSPSTIIVLLFNNKDNLSLIFNTGISGYLSKEEDLKNIALVVRTVCSGGYYFSPSMINFIKQDDISEQARQFLTPAERSIATLIARGYTDIEIAGQINLSLGSVKNCVNAIKSKLKARNREHMVANSIIYRLIDLDHSNRQFQEYTIK
jgi:DNA-binding NarL/FixJ family response regulator